MFTSHHTTTTTTTNKNNNPDECIETYRTLTEKVTLAATDYDSSDDDPDSDAELCNIRFSLAYGGKILLHQTKLRLRNLRYCSNFFTGTFVPLSVTDSFFPSDLAILPAMS